jgi:hypothetical protein
MHRIPDFIHLVSKLAAEGRRLDILRFFSLATPYDSGTRVQVAVGADHRSLAEAERDGGDRHVHLANWPAAPPQVGCELPVRLGRLLREGPNDQLTQDSKEEKMTCRILARNPARHHSNASTFPMSRILPAQASIARFLQESARMDLQPWQLRQRKFQDNHGMSSTKTKTSSDLSRRAKAAKKKRRSFRALKSLGLWGDRTDVANPVEFTKHSRAAIASTRNRTNS